MIGVHEHPASADEVRKYAADHHLTFPIALDDGAGGTAGRYSSSTGPSQLIIGRDGRVLGGAELRYYDLLGAVRCAVLYSEPEAKAKPAAERPAAPPADKATKADGPGKKDAKPDGGGVRILRFPADRSLGVVHTRPAREARDDVSEYADWQPLGDARGEVRLPKDAEVRLVVSSIGSKDLSPLGRLHADDVQSLSLRGTQVNDDQFRHVGRLTGLAHLELEQTEITDAGIKHLADLVNLRFVDLSAFGVNARGFGIGDDSLRILAKLPRLSRLSLRLTKVSDAGMAHMAGMKALRSLSIGGTRVTDAGLVHLKELPARRVSRPGLP